MYCLKPLTITPAMLTSSIAEVDTGETAWVSGATCALADVRTYSTRKYERLVAGAGTITPDLDPTNWLDVGPTNKWAMFDTLRNTQSSAASPITVSIVPAQRIRSIALVRCEASSITITITVGGETKYTTTRNMNGRHTTTATEYCFGGFKFIPNLSILDLPPYAASTITVTITNAVAAAKVGALCIGNPVYLGGTEYNAVRGALNFSEIERSRFGDVKLTPRPSKPETQQTLWIKKAAVNSVIALFEDTDAVPCIWSGLDDVNTDDYYDALFLLGIHREWSVSLAYPTNAKVSLQIEEV